MLSKGLKDEENERLSRILESLLNIEFVPDLWEKEQRQEVDKQLETAYLLSIKFIIETNVDILLEKLHTQNLSFENYEQLGDLLLKIIEVESKENQSNLAEKTIAIYEYAQLESKTFSFDLIQKIQKAQSYRL
ncbi:hypothetical protein JoomaDRAFT_1449 [Galbibacter orientalis DSM 19592]|uniref:Uncharacterized protein n=1 Tax=Galbibacter orientalis DSM 19592 TaxID=926559 RepID=I3C4C1_9FLAO|nr:hypothetical protein [Galbibacter orientalis]EIJ38464.1 hypothetical protein JoomaDRAFT_1449 [Galbibacter orientalis DSM 19592]